jgi:uncharacterized protein with PQ loop repeat
MPFIPVLHNSESTKIQQDMVSFKHFAGLIATIVGVISFIPILFTVYETKKTSNFPYRALILALTSNILWLYYAMAKDKLVDYQLAIMAILYFFIYSFILYTKAFS